MARKKDRQSTQSAFERGDRSAMGLGKLDAAIVCRADGSVECWGPDLELGDSIPAIMLAIMIMARRLVDDEDLTTRIADSDPDFSSIGKAGHA